MTEQDRLDFLKELLPHAKSIEAKHGIPYVANMSQAVLESNWGAKRVGKYNLYGIKGKGTWALTTEYDKNEHAYDKYNVESKEKVGDKWKFKVWLEFQSYESVEACMLDHNRLLLTDRYKHCLRWKHSPKRYLIAVYRSGYATDPLYPYKILGATKDGVKHYSIVDSVTKRLKSL